MIEAEVKARARERDPEANSGPVRTDMHCHNCSKNFIARLEFDIDGNHVVLCPHCGHEHCRVIVDGKVTGDRWDSRYGTVPVEEWNVWKATELKIRSSTATMFLMERWLNFGE